MDDSFDDDALNALLIPEIAMNIEDTPVELNDEPIKSQTSEEHNGEVTEGTDVVINDASDEVIPFVPASLDTNQENENPAQIPEIYTLEEVAVYQQIFGPGQQAVQYLRLHCTACNEHLGSAVDKHHKRYIHPLLKVLICKRCYEFYGSGDFDKDEDGSELYCRWCGQGGKVLCCAQCPYVFCQRCIRVNLGKKALSVVKDSDDWTCFACKPLQIINLRIICRALYDYVQEETRLAAELKQPERLSIDHSLCCQGKPTKVVTVKRKRSNSEDAPYDPLLNNDDIVRKKKKIKLNVLAHKSTISDANLPVKKDPPKAWVSNNVEDEVVCTPDLTLLMDDDESPQPSCSTGYSLLQPPPLRAISPFENGVNKKKDSEVQYIGQTKVSGNFKSLKVQKKNLGYKIPSTVVLNTTTNKPLTSNNITPNIVQLQAPAVKYLGNKDKIHQPVVTVAHNRNNSVIDATPAKLAPGLRYEWFDKAAQVTARVNTNLSTRLATLSKEQTTVSSLEGLASIHNNLQEILSNSINSLMQIRKNLRSDFIFGLKKLKFCKTGSTSQSRHVPDDDDVLIVDSHTPIADPVPNGNKIKNYIKVKPVSELLDSAIITIPDDNATSDNTVKPFMGSSSPIPEDKEKSEVMNEPPPEIEIQEDAPEPNKEKPDKKKEPDNKKEADNEKEPDNKKEPDDKKEPDNKLEPSTSSYTDANDAFAEISEDLNPETLSLIKRAVSESKFEAIVNDNLKFKAAEVPDSLLKPILSVRVVVETNFGPRTPKTRFYKGYKAMNNQVDENDFEQMLSSSIVLNTSKRKAFDDSFSAFIANRNAKDEESSESLDDNDDFDDKENSGDQQELTKRDDLGEGILRDEETSQDPRTTDSGIDVDGEQSLSNGDKNDNEAC